MSIRIRVAHVIASTGLYGAEQWILALLRHLPPHGIEGVLVNLVDEPGHTSEVVRAATTRGLYAVDLYTGGRFSPRSIARLTRFARASGCRIFHSHGYKADLTALVAARLSGTRAISTPHGWSRERDRWLALYESLDRRALRWFDAVCPLSPDLRDGLRHSGLREHKLRMILNGVDIEVVDGVPAADRPRQAGGTYIGYVGQLIARKNVECLIRAFASLSARRDDLHLVIVGDGPRSAALRQLARVCPRVEFTGYRHSAIALMKTFDLFVLPSFEEGIPRCLMEAMAARVPVIASDIPGNRELVEHQVTGLLFPPEQPEQLARAIPAMIERPEHAKVMARGARTLIETRFSAARMAGEYASLYEQC